MRGRRIPLHIQRLRRQFAALQEAEGIPFLSWLENVASMGDRVRDVYDKVMETKAVYIQAGHCGWTQRNRLYWAKAPCTGVMELPEHCLLRERRDVPEMMYTGAKPIQACIDAASVRARMAAPARASTG